MVDTVPLYVQGQLFFQGFLFHRNGKYKDSEYWACQEANPRDQDACKCSLRTVEGVVKTIKRQHNHVKPSAPSSKDVEAYDKVFAQQHPSHKSSQAQAKDSSKKSLQSKKKKSVAKSIPVDKSASKKVSASKSASASKTNKKVTSSLVANGDGKKKKNSKKEQIETSVKTNKNSKKQPEPVDDAPALADVRIHLRRANVHHRTSVVIDDHSLSPEPRETPAQPEAGMLSGFLSRLSGIFSGSNQ